jgi:hypothetical protein
MTEYIKGLLSGLTKTDKTGFSEHIITVPMHLLDDVLAEVAARWVAADDPWQRYDEAWPQWKGSLPVSRLQYPEHPKEYATVRVWRTRVYSDGAVHHDRAVYSFISVLEHGASKTAQEWAAELSDAVQRRDLTYQALMPSSIVADVLRSIDGGPIRPSRSRVHDYSTGDNSRMVPDGYEEVSLCYWARDNDPIIKGHWLAPWVDVMRKSDDSDEVTL